MYSWRSISLVILGMLTMLSSPVEAEVIWAKIYWKSDFCPPSCYPLLERRLRAIDSVSRVDFNFAEGFAKLVWKPTVPYEDRKIRTPMAWVGLAIHNVRVRIRGTIIHDNGDVYIVSLGDETKMPLLSPPKPEEGRYITKPNRVACCLEPKLKERLLEAENKHEVVTLEGSVIQPHRPPVHLSVESAEYHAVE